MSEAHRQCSHAVVLHHALRLDLVKSSVCELLCPSSPSFTAKLHGELGSYPYLQLHPTLADCLPQETQKQHASPLNAM